MSMKNLFLYALSTYLIFLTHSHRLAVGRTIAPPSDASAAAAKPAPARLEPSKGSYFGLNLDWSIDSPAQAAQRMGIKPNVYVVFVKFPLQEDDIANLDNASSLVKSVKGMLLVTLEPFEGLAAITEQEARSFAYRLKAYNQKGVKVFVRFAHEMNGSWYPWSQQPTAYVNAFRTMAQAMHSIVPKKSAILWAPNYGGGYPFSGGQYEVRPGTTDYEILDTNKDGVVNKYDDPYSPYYPGDDAVDWVGMTLYHWGKAYPWGENEFPEKDKFQDQLTGNYDGDNGDDTMVPDFYAEYAEARNKPLAIPETSALFVPATGTPDIERQIKESWWNQFLRPDFMQEFPRIKMINWFEWLKAESEIGGETVDWRVTFRQDLLSRFVYDLKQARVGIPAYRSKPAPLLPRKNAYLGLDIDWSSDSPAAAAQRMGIKPNVFDRTIKFPLDDQEAAALDAAIGQIKGVKGIALISLEPWNGLASVTEQEAAAFAERLKGYNRKGVKVIVRFAREMNGSWYPWSQQPSEYIAAFRTLAQAVHAASPKKSAMLWSPIYGGGYPFSGGQYQAQPGTPDYFLLDTNNDGQVNEFDDPYMPYYPGDDVVDWIGISLFHWGNKYPWGENDIPELDKFQAQLTGSYNGDNGDETMVPDFYTEYALGRNKPLAPETAALFVPATGTSDLELLIKETWWHEFIQPGFREAYPQTRMFIWYEWNKLEPGAGETIDWRVTYRQDLLADFLKDLKLAKIGN